MTHYVCPLCGVQFETISTEPGQWLICPGCRNPFRILGQQSTQHELVKESATATTVPVFNSSDFETVETDSTTEEIEFTRVKKPPPLSASRAKAAQTSQVRPRKKDDAIPIRTRRNQVNEQHAFWIRLFGVAVALGLVGAVLGIASASLGFFGQSAKPGEIRYRLAGVFGASGGVGLGLLIAVFLQKQRRK
jgi:DNA-directed RNA polymerase subunit RPC12/RpoP